MFGTVASLLKEYNLANPRIMIETVDYLRDAGAAQQVKAAYKLDAATDRNLVIFDCEGRTQPVPGDVLAKYLLAKRLDEKGETELFKKPIEFLGEKMFTSALLAVTNPKPLKACFLKGHGEHPLGSDNPDYGYLKFAALLEQNYIRPEPLELLGTNGVPMDCNLLVIAGPRTSIPDFELAKIDQYLSQGGRLIDLCQFKIRNGDRKSTRLNSSHQIISYAVFCLKKKKNLLNTLGRAKAKGITFGIITYILSCVSPGMV